MLLLILILLKLKDSSFIQYKVILYKVSKLHKITISEYIEDLESGMFGNRAYYKINIKESNYYYNKELLQCLESGLISYLLPEKDKLGEILNVISSSKKYWDAFLCDSNGFNFKIYDSNNKLIDTIYVWEDGKRLIPASIHGSSSYYLVLKDTNLRKIIEDKIDYVFYNILNF
ncbi:MAG: hypothetical protein RR050_03660 [Bacilli bacterium]